MQVKVRYKDILCETEKALLFLISEREVWLPKKIFRMKGNFIICSLYWAEKLELKYSTYIHIPKHIVPKYNQEAKEELRFNPT